MCFDVFHVIFVCMQKILIANWKENPGTLPEAKKLFSGYKKIRFSKGVKVAVCPPVIFLPELVAPKSFALGAQDAFWEDKGAFTGEISPKMLKAVGVRYVIIGHSERRINLGETNKMVARKSRKVLDDGLVPVVCVGEGLPIRKRGIVAAKKFVLTQISKSLAEIQSGESVIVAYEPVWAISTNPGAIPDSPESAVEMIVAIRAELKKLGIKAKVLYGGSVKPENARGFLERKEIDGALVGGASLDPKSFKKIADTIKIKSKNNN